MASGGALVNHIWVHFFILLSIFVVSRSEQETCHYTIYVRTGTIIKGGTDSTISLSLYDLNGYGLRIKDLVAWGGQMGPDHDYFERGNVDIFSAKYPCLTAPVCRMNLTSDGSGKDNAWYCDYVDVIACRSGKPYRQFFSVNQWLASYVYPFKLTAIRNNCDKVKMAALKTVDFESPSGVSVM